MRYPCSAPALQILLRKDFYFFIKFQKGRVWLELRIPSSKNTFLGYLKNLFLVKVEPKSENLERSWILLSILRLLISSLGNCLGHCIENTYTVPELFIILFLSLLMSLKYEKSHKIERWKRYNPLEPQGIDTHWTVSFIAWACSKLQGEM